MGKLKDEVGGAPHVIMAEQRRHLQRRRQWLFRSIGEAVLHTYDETHRFADVKGIFGLVPIYISSSRLVGDRYVVNHVWRLIFSAAPLYAKSRTCVHYCNF